MNQLRFPAVIWFLLALIGVYLLWTVLRTSFVEAEPAKPEKVIEQPQTKATLPPIVLASAENTEASQVTDTPPDSKTPTPTPVECLDEIISLTLISGEPRELCVESRDVIQNGESRTYLFRTKGAEPFTLRIRASGRIIEAVEFEGGKNGILSCEADQCNGVAIGKRDAKGRRHIKIDMSLPSSNKKEDASGDSIGIRADLKTKPDHEVAALNCVGQGVTMIGGDNSSVTFCPLGGNGFSATEDGSSVTYQFRNLENEMISVTVNESQVIQKIGFDADRLFCLAENCSGAAISSPNEKGERIFSFSGTMLREFGGENEMVILNGTLILQPIS